MYRTADLIIFKNKRIRSNPFLLFYACLFMGDWHYSSVFGPERASFISPANSALKAGIIFTIHHDAPVTPPDLITAVYAAVNRKTRSGMILGPNEKSPPLKR